MSSVPLYQPGEFTLEAYRSLVARTVESYPLRGFELLAEPDLPERFCILRHDIDMSPKAALRLAQIEASSGARATYTVLLTGQHYSPFEKKTATILREISALGHDIGLHFDAAWHDIDNHEALDVAVAREAIMLADLVGTEIRCFSFHNTTAFTMAAHADSYGGLWNAYAGRLQYAVAYVSDSNGYWQFKSWDKMLGEAPPRLQVLTHADWWLEEDLPPSENVSRILEARSRDTWADYVSTLTRAGRTMMCGTPVVQEVLVRQLNEPEIWRLWLAGDETSAYMKLLALLASERTVARPEVSAEQRAFVESLCAGQVPDAAVLGSLFEAAARELIALRAPGSAIAD